MQTARSEARNRSRIPTLVALILIVAGLAVLFLSVYGTDVHAISGPKKSGAGAIPHHATQQSQSANENLAPVPKNTNLKVTIPSMVRVKGVTAQDGPGNDEQALRQGVLHVRGTGFPWQKDANVYVAGHRMGYVGTDSFLVFYDLNKLHKNDKVILTDANGTRYTYTVYKKVIVDPSDVAVTRTVPDKSVLTLQTCTLPNFSQRLIVQAGLTHVS